MVHRGKLAEMKVQDEQAQSLDAWIAADLHDRYGAVEPLPDAWLDLVEHIEADD